MHRPALAGTLECSSSNDDAWHVSMPGIHHRKVYSSNGEWDFP
jgi:hypothetical protein